ncbi:Gfo/Idh/MocA family oxidoreductase [Ruminococcaceae bacterium OttesenSCG-928-A16]|nr:Gfo/Idh/MocA family oxidoreductase [Ruminococcaceae bacterium OttesenSCG-928-A16]
MKLLIVGLGSMGKRRARLILGLKAGHTIAGVDNSAGRCEEARALGIQAFTSLPDALEAEKFDAAFVCTAPLTHAIIIDELLNAGLPVFSELNLVEDGYEGLITKAKEKGLTLFLSSTMLYRAETDYIAQQVQAFKKPVNYIYHVGQYLPDWHPWENYKNFFVGDARTGGVREILGIDLPWLISAFGPVKSAHVEKDKISNLEVDYPDSYFITLRHTSGNKGFLAVDVVSPKAVRNFEAFGEGLHLFWEGNPRSLYTYNATTKEKELVNTYSEFEHDPRYSDNIVENAYVDEILNFFAVVQGAAVPKWSFEQDLEVIHLMEQIEGRGPEETK